MTNDDPHFWLEEVGGEKALRWAERQNERSLARLQAHPLFDTLYERNLQIFTSEKRIAYPTQMGGRIYNFWRDANSVRGIWRRTSVEEYRKARPPWETVVDLDQLAGAEKENWVWGGAAACHPEYDRCIISTSRGGADASVRREFDLKKLEFVSDGFSLPEAKSRITWRERDSVFVGTDFGKGSLTDSGYPRLVKLWRRGRPLEEAVTVLEGRVEDVSVGAYRSWDGADSYDIVFQATGFFTRNYFLYADGETIPFPVPKDAKLHGVRDGQLLIELKSGWTPGGTTYAQGALIAAPVPNVLRGETSFEVLFEPDARSSIARVALTEKTVLLNILDNVVSHVLRFRRRDGEWRRDALDVPEMGSIQFVSSEDQSGRFYYNYTGFLTPGSLYEADAAANRHQRIKREPTFFDANGMKVEQHQAASKDGTMVPYFVITPRGFQADGRNPTQLYGYGGFEVPLTPNYLASAGHAWLERGGVYVVANIRGGGEFGPRWHQAALKENRQRAYDDFIAVADNLIQKQITSPKHLGIQGRSNGGLLVGAVFVQRPDLFNAVVCQVPLLDMGRYHKLLAGASWMAEFGNPDDPEQWASIGQYSPYQNVTAEAQYPQIFFTTSTRDDRVHPGHARKMVAKMREQGHDVLYYENIEGGHGGAANLNQAAFMTTLVQSYLHDRLHRQ